MSKLKTEKLCLQAAKKRFSVMSMLLVTVFWQKLGCSLYL